MRSIKDFARDCGVSYEAVRKQIKRYDAELQGHIHKQGRTQYLDDVAIAFLVEHRAPAPIAVYDQGVPEEIRALEERNEQLKAENDDLKDRLLRKQDMIINLQGAQARLEAAEKSQKLLEESRDEYKAEAARNAQKASEEAQRAEQAVREAQDLQRRLEAAEASEQRFRSMGLFEFLRERKKGRQA